MSETNKWLVESASPALVGVVGAGIMGAGIAQVAAQAKQLTMASPAGPYLTNAAAAAKRSSSASVSSPPSEAARAPLEQEANDAASSSASV